MILYLAQIGTLAAIFAVLAVSYSLLLGSTGIFSAAHASFFGFGAYAGAVAAIRWEQPFPVDILFGAAVAAVLAVLVSLPMSRLVSEQVLVASLALQLVFASVFENFHSVTGGSSGVYGIGRPELFGYGFYETLPFALLTLVTAAVLIGSIGLMLRRRAWLLLRATRDDALLAKSFGISTHIPRLLAWVIAGSAAGAAGAIFARFVGYLSPASFGISQTLLILTMVVVGGLGSVRGVILGVAVLTAIPELLTYLPADLAAADQLQPLIYSIVLLLVVVFRPQGLLPEGNLKLRRGPAVAVGQSADADDDVSPGDSVTGVEPVEGASRNPAGDTLALVDIRKSFGGLKVLTGVDLELRPNEITAILGPNGAGKTTLFNVMTGVIKPDGGAVRWGGRDVTGASPERLARLGMARSFQDGRVFDSMNVYEHMLLSTHSSTPTFGSFLSRRSDPTTDRRILRVLSELGLQDKVNHEVGDLSYGEQKVLLIAEMMLWRPRILLLDEVAAGLDHRAVDDIAAKIRAMRGPDRIICLVEHNLDFVWKTADRVVLMGDGRIVADGTPDEVRANPLALETYFGKAMLK
jgi:branched-chain amino acid transport system permease protein